MSRLLSCKMSSQVYHFCILFPKPFPKHAWFCKVGNIGYYFCKVISFHH